MALAACAPAAAWADECPKGGRHDYTAKLVRQATDDEDGLRVFTCTKCGDEVRQVIPATGHEWGPWIVDIEPTCTSEGHAYRVCERHAGTEHVEEDVLPMLSATGEHTWRETSRVEPTCEDGGMARLRCTVCGAEMQQPLAALGHEWSGWQVTRAAAEGSEGLEQRTCLRDASHVEMRPIPALPKAAQVEEVYSNSEEPASSPVIAAVSESEEPPKEEQGERDPWAPSALDAALLGVDIAAIIAFAIFAAPLLYVRRWVAARKRMAHESPRTYDDSGLGGRVL